MLRAAMPGIARLAIVSTGYDVDPLRANSQWLLAVFAINRKAAAAIGVKFPAEFAVMASRIVE